MFSGRPMRRTFLAGADLLSLEGATSIFGHARPTRADGSRMTIRVADISAERFSCLIQTRWAEG